MTPDQAHLPQSKADLLDRIQREWAALLAVVETLTVEQMSRQDAGGWSIKDNLAHITAWERFLIRNQFEGQVPPVALGIDQVALQKLDEAGLNAVLLERNRDRSASDVLAALHQTHDYLMAALAQVSEADLQKPTWSLGRQAEPMMMWVIYNTYEHYVEHRRTIQANL